MKKLKIKIVLIGHGDRIVEMKTLKKYNSEHFVINEFEKISNLPPPQKNDGFLDVVYSKDEIAKILENVKFTGIRVGIMNYSFEDNFYMHRVGNNKMCISLSKIDSILTQADISIESFIIKSIYEAFVLYKIFGTLTDNRIYEFIHRDTRGCLFDLTGDKGDVIYNTETPIICEECKAKISRHSVPVGLIDSISKGLKRIHKPWIKTTEMFIKKYPLISIVLAFIFSTLVNLLSSFIWYSFITK